MPVYRSRSEEETEEIAANIAQTLRAGDVVLLSGELGAGKTAFVRGLARGLGVDPLEVSSPTFTLLHEHAGRRLRLCHADLYRLHAAAVADLGLEEAGAQDGVLAIEWPERFGRAPAGAVRVRLTATGPDEREIVVEDGRGAIPFGSSALPS